MNKLNDILNRSGISEAERQGGGMVVHSPIDGAKIAHLHDTPMADVDGVIAKARDAFIRWREVPAPRRGELVRLWGEELRAAKEDIAHIISVEVGKIVEEGAVSDVFEHPKHPYTQALIAAAPKIGQGKRTPGSALKGDVPSLLNPPSGCAFHPRCPVAVDRCRTEAPLLKANVACHLLDEGGS